MSSSNVLFLYHRNCNWPVYQKVEACLHRLTDDSDDCVQKETKMPPRNGVLIELRQDYRESGEHERCYKPARVFESPRVHDVLTMKRRLSLCWISYDGSIIMAISRTARMGNIP